MNGRVCVVTNYFLDNSGYSSTFMYRFINGLFDTLSTDYYFTIINEKKFNSFNESQKIVCVNDYFVIMREQPFEVSEDSGIYSSYYWKPIAYIKLFDRPFYDKYKLILS